MIKNIFEAFKEYKEIEKKLLLADSWFNNSNHDEKTLKEAEKRYYNLVNRQAELYLIIK